MSRKCVARQWTTCLLQPQIQQPALVFEVVLAQFETRVALPERALGSVFPWIAPLCALVGVAHRPSVTPHKHQADRRPERALVASRYSHQAAEMSMPNPTGMRMLRGPCPPSRAAIHMACLGGWCLQGTTAKTAPGSPWSALGRSKVPFFCVSKLRCPPTAKITDFRKSPLARSMKVFVSLRDK